MWSKIKGKIGNLFILLVNCVERAGKPINWLCLLWILELEQGRETHCFTITTALLLNSFSIFFLLLILLND
jgi:hypothetical protein